MNPDQVTAFLTGAGVDASKVKVLVISLVGAFAFLWAAYVVRNLGIEMLHGRLSYKRYAIYTLRSLVILMVLIYFIS